MELIIFLIPVLTVLVLLWKFREETCWWEYLVVLIPSTLLFLVLKYSAIYIKSMDTEYLGDLVNKITYYEDWDETVMVAHHYTTRSGKTTVTHTYYVPERRYHEPEYVYETVYGNKEYVSKDLYNKIINNLNTKPVFKDMHRNYRSKDGDAYVTTWNRTRENSYAVTSMHNYINKVNASKYSIFKYSDMCKEEIIDNKLFDYPDIIDADQNPIMFNNQNIKISKSDIDAVRFLNGYRGPRNQIRVYILCFDSPMLDIAEMQKAYWQGGNKNEFVVCVGIKNNKIIWCNPFSWCDKPELEVMTRDYFIKNPDIDFKSYAEWLDTKIDKHWHRKSFDDFKYIDISLSNTSYIIILILILLYNVGISYWVITNNYTLNDPYNKDYMKKKNIVNYFSKF